MQEGKRQKQVGALLMHELSDIFQRLGLGMIEGGLVSLTAVKLTPDLLEARVFLSLFQVKDVTAAMKKIEERAWEIKRELALRVKHQLRRIPTLQYTYDDTLEHADRMQALFRKIQEEGGKPPGEGGTGEAGSSGEQGEGRGGKPGQEGRSGEQGEEGLAPKGRKPRGEEGPA